MQIIWKRLLNYPSYLNYPIQTLIAIIFVITVAGCASSLEQPVRDIVVVFDKLEYIDTTKDGVQFVASGHLKNPNEFSIRPLHFTYQVNLDGQHYKKGSIHVRGEDEQIHLKLDIENTNFNLLDVKNIDTENLDVIDVGGTNAKLKFKSNSPFQFKLNIPFSALGGFGKAMERQTLPYSINLIFTDERIKRATHVEKGIINLAVILRPIVFRNLVIESQGDYSQITFGLFNNNKFDFTGHSCGYQLTSQNVVVDSRVVGEDLSIPAHRWKFIKVQEKIALSKGTPYSFEGWCSIDQSRFVHTIDGYVQ